MATLKHAQTTPPGGWRYRQIETGLVLIGDSLHDLVARVVSHRRYKGLKPDDEPTVSLDVQRQICTRLGKDECRSEDAADAWTPQPTTRRFTLEDMLAFTRTMLEFIRSGGALVEKAEAQRRREICAACPLNQPAVGCKCAVFYKAINAVLPADRKFPELHVCAVCSCSTAVKVNVPMEVLKADKRKLAFPVHCWLA